MEEGEEEGGERGRGRRGRGRRERKGGREGEKFRGGGRKCVRMRRCCSTNDVFDTMGFVDFESTVS